MLQWSFLLLIFVQGRDGEVGFCNSDTDMETPSPSWRMVSCRTRVRLEEWARILRDCMILYCQAQPKVQTKASAFGWDGYNIIIIQPPTHPDKYEGDEIEQNLENESCLSVWVKPKNVPCPNLKNSQITAKNFSISLFLCYLSLIGRKFCNLV